MANANYRDDEDTPPSDDPPYVPDNTPAPGPGDMPPPDQYPINPSPDEAGNEPPYTGPMGPLSLPPRPVNFFPPNRSPRPPNPPLTPPARPPVTPTTARPAAPGAAPQRPPQPPPPKPGPFGQPPFRPAERQQWVPPVGNRRSFFWGKPPQFPMLPPVWQIPMIFQALSGQLGMWGSGSMTLPGSTQYLAGNLGGQSGAYMEGYIRGQSMVADLKYKQMRQTAEALEIKQARELNEYGDIAAEYQDGARDPQGYMRSLWLKASEIGDEPMKKAIEMGPDAVYDLLHYRDNKYQTTHVANQKMKAEDAKASAWPSSGGTSTAAAATPGGTTGAIGGLATGEPTPSVRGAMPTGVPRDQFGRPIPQAPVQAAAGPMKLSDPGEEANAVREYRGEAWDKQGIPADALSRIQHRAAIMRAQEDEALDSEASPEDKLAALQRVNPGMANEVQAALNYDTRVGYGRNGMPPRIANLAHRVDPNWHQPTYQFITEFQNPNSWQQKTLARSGTMVGAAERVLDTAKALIGTGVKLDDPSGIMNLRYFLDGKFAGRPEWSDFMNAYNAYVQELVAVTRGGTGNEGDITREMQITRPTGSIREILAALGTDAHIALGRMDQARKLWDSRTQGRQGAAPGYFEDTATLMRGMETLDPNTFKFSKDAPQELKDREVEGVGGPIEQQRKKERTEDVRTKNLSPEDKSVADWAIAHPHDPRAQQVLKELGIQ